MTGFCACGHWHSVAPGVGKNSNDDHEKKWGKELEPMEKRESEQGTEKKKEEILQASRPTWISYDSWLHRRRVRKQAINRRLGYSGSELDVQKCLHDRGRSPQSSFEEGRTDWENPKKQMNSSTSSPLPLALSSMNSRSTDAGLEGKVEVSCQPRAQHRSIAMERSAILVDFVEGE